MFFTFHTLDNPSSSANSLEDIQILKKSKPKIFEKIEFGLDKFSLEINPLFNIKFFKLVNCTFQSEYDEICLEEANLVIAIGLHLKVFGIYFSL
jgi:hypothetical protein